MDSINENSKNIRRLSFNIEEIKKDLNISNRLSKIEAYLDLGWKKRVVC